MTYRDRDAGREDQEDEGEAEEDLQPVGRGPVVPGLGVDPHLAQDAGGRGQAGLAGVGDLATVLSAGPGEEETLGVGRVLWRQLREEVRVGDVLPGTEPGPAVLAQPHTGGEDGLGGREVFQCQLA